jgi:hypothetical protein
MNSIDAKPEGRNESESAGFDDGARLGYIDNEIEWPCLDGLIVRFSLNSH